MQVLDFVFELLQAVHFAFDRSETRQNLVERFGHAAELVLHFAIHGGIFGLLLSRGRMSKDEESTSGETNQCDATHGNPPWTPGREDKAGPAFRRKNSAVLGNEEWENGARTGNSELRTMDAARKTGWTLQLIRRWLITAKQSFATLLAAPAAALHRVLTFDELLVEGERFVGFDGDGTLNGNVAGQEDGEVVRTGG